MTLYTALIIGIYAAAATTFALLMYIKAPYGRYVRQGWGPVINARAAWIVMEAPAVFVILALYVFSPRKTVVVTVFIVLWQLHYLYRTFVYPMLMRGAQKAFPYALIAMALIFNTANGYVNGWYLFYGARSYDLSWLTDPRFIIGALCFFTGMYIHVRSDHILRHLRAPGETDYRIPEGGLYRYISAPNYFGEILQWVGWAIATWSVAGLSFAVFTIANLLPRGIAHHNWYKSAFPDYPPDRKAVIPRLL